MVNRLYRSLRGSAMPESAVSGTHARGMMRDDMVNEARMAHRQKSVCRGEPRRPALRSDAGEVVKVRQGTLALAGIRATGSLYVAGSVARTRPRHG